MTTPSETSTRFLSRVDVSVLVFTHNPHPPRTPSFLSTIPQSKVKGSEGGTLNCCIPISQKHLNTDPTTGSRPAETSQEEGTRDGPDDGRYNRGVFGIETRSIDPRYETETLVSLDQTRGQDVDRSVHWNPHNEW